MVHAVMYLSVGFGKEGLRLCGWAFYLGCGGCCGLDGGWGILGTGVDGSYCLLFVLWGSL